MADYYGGRESLPGITCGGELTLGENIAGLGSLACITQISSGLEDPDYAAMYRSMAAAWAAIGARKYQFFLSRANVHAPHKLRVNLPLQSCDEFYETFGIAEGDGMRIPPEERVSIW